MAINKKDEDLDFEIIFSKFLKNYKFILSFTLLFSIIGILISFSLKNKFSSSVVFVNKNLTQQSNSNLNSIANLTGINLNLNQEDLFIHPNLYLLIFENDFIKKDILQINLDSNYTFKDFLIDDNNLEFDSIINVENKNLFNDSNNISYLEYSLFELIPNYIIIQNNLSAGYTEIKSESSSPEYSYILAKEVYSILEKFIIEKNVSANKELLLYSENNLKIKKEEFVKAQRKLSEFNDNNINVSSSKFSSKLYILQSEFDIINSVVSEISRNIEKIKLQIKKDISSLTVIKYPSIPNSPFYPKKTAITIIFSIVGLISSVIYILIKDIIIIHFFKKNHNN